MNRPIRYVPRETQGLPVAPVVIETPPLDQFVRQYLGTALWSSVDCDTGVPLDRDFDIEDFSAEAVIQAIKDCTDFRQANAADLENIEETDAAHDFWLTRCRHGAGFWDRGLGELGRRLTQACHAYGERNVLAGDNGKLYIE